MNKKYWSLLFVTLLCTILTYGQPKPTADTYILVGSDGQLTYKTTGLGDRVPDYSYCGYRYSQSPIPTVPVKIIVPVVQGDATAVIQAAINKVAALPVDKNGFRGTVLLEKGTYTLTGSLYIQSSGVVLRGSGSGIDGTTILGAGVDRATLIEVTGINDRRIEKVIPVTSNYYPVNTTQLHFTAPHPYKQGDAVVVNRPSTKEWIEKLGADKIGSYVDYSLTKWEPGDFDQQWHRRVIAVTPTSITLDVPLPNSLDPQYGGGTVARYTWKGQLQNVGIENLRCVSAYDTTNTKDENHRWMAITLNHVRDGWVRRVVAEHFVSSAVAIWEGAQRITVEDCKSLVPVGEIGNHRRFSFHTTGQQVLFQRCYAEYGYHDFSVGFTTPGPNAFVQCYSYLPYNFSGAIGGWATGVLFDKTTIDGGNLSLGYRDADGQGGGWSAANSLSWQTRAAQLHLSAPPTAHNWAYGSWAQGYGAGYHELPHVFLKPESLFYAQLKARTGKASPEEEKILLYTTDRTTAPLPALTAALSKRSETPDITIREWIDTIMLRYPIVSDRSGAKTVVLPAVKKAASTVSKALPITFRNGQIVSGNSILTGKRNRTTMWRGSTRPKEQAAASPNLVRFVPGRTGRGLTDDLDTVVSDMLHNSVVVMQSFPALWYERRRDDHARTRRADADVWAPFYEQPFSRSGIGEAYDRLSKYDLTKWNTWYWLRLKQFADKADQNGLVYIQEHYLQHNIIEEGAHWTDYPWRTANNINNPGFAENPHYAGDKRIFMAEAFYDTAHAIRKQLHRDYIRKSLDNFIGNTNIIHHLGLEYTGPLPFVQFWPDVIGEWEREKGQDVKVMLPGTKDIQDAILADPWRSKLIDAIDVIQWQYRKDSSLYAPLGGQSLAQRQYARIQSVGETSFGQIYWAVKEFRSFHPQKAILYSRGGHPFAEWAAFMAGGSLAAIPSIKDNRFSDQAATMIPLPSKATDSLQYALGKKGKGYIIFSESGTVSLPLAGDNNRYSLKWIHPITGEIRTTQKKVTAGTATTLQAPFEGAAVAWLTIE